MPKTTRASVMLTETIIGVIIGIVLFISLLALGRKILTTQ